jgi:hypothetical protein
LVIKRKGKKAKKRFLFSVVGFGLLIERELTKEKFGKKCTKSRERRNQEVGEEEEEAETEIPIRCKT